jgi:hypothetical protein
MPNLESFIIKIKSINGEFFFQIPRDFLYLFRVPCPILSTTLKSLPRLSSFLTPRSTFIDLSVFFYLINLNEKFICMNKKNWRSKDLFKNFQIFFSLDFFFFALYMTTPNVPTAQNQKSVILGPLDPPPNMA